MDKFAAINLTLNIVIVILVVYCCWFRCCRPCGSNSGNGGNGSSSGGGTFNPSCQVVNNSGTLIHKVFVGGVEFTENLSYCGDGCSTGFLDVPLGSNNIQLQQTSGGTMLELGDIGPFENGRHHAVNIRTLGGEFCAELWHRTDTNSEFNNDTSRTLISGNCP